MRRFFPFHWPHQQSRPVFLAYGAQCGGRLDFPFFFPINDRRLPFLPLAILRKGASLFFPKAINSFYAECLLLLLQWSISPLFGRSLAVFLPRSRSASLFCACKWFGSFRRGSPPLLEKPTALEFSGFLGHVARGESDWFFPPCTQQGAFSFFLEQNK